MYINIKNKISILPFVIETSGIELIENWDAKDLHIEKSGFYLIETLENELIWLNEWFMIPMFINGKFVEKSVKELFKTEKLDEIKLLKYHSNIGMDLEVKNKLMKDLFKDFSFKFVGIKSIKLVGMENCIRVDEMVKKLILIDNFLFLLPNMKSISYLRETMLSIIKTKIKKSDIDEKEELIKEILKLKSLLKLNEDEKKEKIDTKEIFKIIIKDYYREEKQKDKKITINNLIDEIKYEIEKETEK